MEPLFTAHYTSPLGQMTMASDGESLVGLWFDGQKYFASCFPLQSTPSDLSVFQQTRKWLDIYFQGKEPSFTPLLKLTGSPFRQMVARIMLDIPYGQTTTYGRIAMEVARQTGRQTMSAQAVGGAVGHNPVSVIIPCHRVLGTDGSLTGYAGGVERKTALLELERVGQLTSVFREVR